MFIVWYVVCGHAMHTELYCLVCRGGRAAVLPVCVIMKTYENEVSDVCLTRNVLNYPRRRRWRQSVYKYNMASHCSHAPIINIIIIIKLMQQTQMTDAVSFLVASYIC